MFEILLRIEMTVLRRAATTVGSAGLSAGYTERQDPGRMGQTLRLPPEEAWFPQFPPSISRGLQGCSHTIDHRICTTQHQIGRRRKVKVAGGEPSPE